MDGLGEQVEMMRRELMELRAELRALRAAADEAGPDEQAQPRIRVVAGSGANVDFLDGAYIVSLRQGAISDIRYNAETHRIQVLHTGADPEDDDSWKDRIQFVEEDW